VLTYRMCPQAWRCGVLELDSEDEGGDFHLKTTVIINHASQRNNTQDVNLQATILKDLKSQKAVMLTLVNLGLMRSALNIERNFLKALNRFMYVRHYI
jgi:hypothetical protein